jgi:hypothetical protein
MTVVTTTTSNTTSEDAGKIKVSELPVVIANCKSTGMTTFLQIPNADGTGWYSYYIDKLPLGVLNWIDSKKKTRKSLFAVGSQSSMAYSEDYCELYACILPAGTFILVLWNEAEKCPYELMLETNGPQSIVSFYKEIIPADLL